MSYVTNVLLLCDIGEEVDDDKFPVIDAINAWLLNNFQHSGLAHLNGHEGGHKGWEADVFGGAFNYLPIDEFVKFVAAAQWKNLEAVQILIKDQDEDVWGLLHIVDPQQSRLGSRATANARLALGREKPDEPWE